MSRIAYILVLIGAAFGGFEFLNMYAYADSAPQQAAGAAMAIAWVVLPYGFARAIEKLAEAPIAHTLEQHWKREENAKPQPPAPSQPPMPTTPPSPAPRKFNPNTGQPLAGNPLFPRNKP